MTENEDDDVGIFYGMLPTKKEIERRRALERERSTYRIWQEYKMDMQEIKNRGD